MEDLKNTRSEGNIETPKPEGKTFTQDDVNRIVQERLARERSKTESDTVNEREKELQIRENRLACREYLAENNFPSELAEIFDTMDSETFKETVGKLMEKYPVLNPNVEVPRMVSSTPGPLKSENDGKELAAAFGLK